MQLGEIVIPQQELGVANLSSSTGSDEVSVGIIGFGYPSITAVHPDAYALNESLLLDRVRYPTVWDSLAAMGAETFIGMALERTERNEEIGFGEWPFRFSFASFLEN